MSRSGWDDKATPEDVEETDRPVLFETSLRPEYHRPALIEGELETACGREVMRQYEVRDHFEVRNRRACSQCFPDGVPFSYERKEYTYDEEEGGNSSRIPSELLPDGELKIGSVENSGGY